MKTRLLRIILPVLAIIVAATSSLAFSKSKSNLNDDMLIEGYYHGKFAPGCLDSPVVECGLSGNQICTINILGPEPPYIFQTEVYYDANCMILLYKSE